MVSPARTLLFLERFQPCTFFFAEQQCVLPAYEQEGKNSKGFKDFQLKAEDRIWPWLSHMCHIRSTASLKAVLRVTRRVARDRLAPIAVAPVETSQNLFEFMLFEALILRL